MSKDTQIYNIHIIIYETFTSFILFIENKDFMNLFFKI